MEEWVEWVVHIINILYVCRVFGYYGCCSWFSLLFLLPRVFLSPLLLPSSSLCSSEWWLSWSGRFSSWSGLIQCLFGCIFRWVVTVLVRLIQFPVWFDSVLLGFSSSLSNNTGNGLCLQTYSVFQPAHFVLRARMTVGSLIQSPYERANWWFIQFFVSVFSLLISVIRSLVICTGKGGWVCLVWWIRCYALVCNLGTYQFFFSVHAYCY